MIVFWLETVERREGITFPRTSRFSVVCNAYSFRYRKLMLVSIRLYYLNEVYVSFCWFVKLIAISFDSLV